MIRAVEVERCRVVALVATIAVCAAMPVSAGEGRSDGRWHFTVPPYLWLPDVNGTVTYPHAAGSGASVSAQVDVFNSNQLDMRMTGPALGASFRF